VENGWPGADPAPIEAPSASEVPFGARCGVHETVDASFLCVVCGTYGCMECIFATGERGTTCKACAARGLAESIPWERRAHLGWMKAFWQTTKLVCTQPKRFFSTPSTETGMVGPILYAVLAYTLGGALMMLSFGVLFLLGSGGALLAGQNEIGAIFGIYGGCFTVGAVPIALIGYPLQGLMQVLIAAACSHGSLVLLKSRSATFEQTLRAVCYANAPYFWLFVPCVGWYFSAFWVWGAESIALRETHRTTTDRAVLSVIGYRVLFIGLVVGLYLLMLGVMFALGAAQGSNAYGHQP
jgi:hypothetical protein